MGLPDSPRAIDQRVRAQIRAGVSGVHLSRESTRPLALRVVVRAGMSHDMADLFLSAVRKQTASLEALQAPLPQRSDDEVAAFKALRSSSLE